MKDKKYKSPKVSDKKGYRPTNAVLADTYDERTLEEMKETLAATVYAETFPDILDYEVLGERNKQPVKNKYNFPRHATNSNNPVYNQYVEDVYFEEDYVQPKETQNKKIVADWRKNGRIDLYHDETDGNGVYQDPYTVAQHFYDRTTMPYG